MAKDGKNRRVFDLVKVTKVMASPVDGGNRLVILPL